MELNINSPLYYKELHGIDNEIYELCQQMHMYFRDKKYSDIIDTVGIVPIIAPHELILQGRYKERKFCSRAYRFADVNLFIDYKQYINADIEEKRNLIVINVLDSIKAVKTKGKIDFISFRKDMIIFCKENNIIID